ncbi:hypothetical protein [Streptomyces sp. SID13726]|uniref:hypothetical protein n=1 Tax=Streptomyces sp. SID13726 TaxID=2706058 RepID=UPI0013BB7BF9|nr:hypothetical protein [Streptomyces sp. SID13726]NEB03300.1 hypothetical protein [Streptomyces sp. SID13726]
MPSTARVPYLLPPVLSVPSVPPGSGPSARAFAGAALFAVRRRRRRTADRVPGIPRTEAESTGAMT